MFIRLRLVYPLGRKFIFRRPNYRPRGNRSISRVAFSPNWQFGRSLPSSQIVPELLDAARKFAPDFTPNTAETMEQIVDDSIGSQTLAARLMFIFAAAALLIAMAGVYGVLAYSVTQRRHEMGIRIALGAKRSDVLMLILKNAALLLALGLGAGIAISMLTAHAIRSLLFGVGGHDAVTIISVCVLLTACGMIAAFVPARRAACIEPMETLRIE